MAEDTVENQEVKGQTSSGDGVQAAADALRATIRQNRAARNLDGAQSVPASVIPTLPLTDVVTPTKQPAAGSDDGANVSPAVWRVHPDRLAAQEQRAAAEASSSVVTTGATPAGKENVVTVGALPIVAGSSSSNDGVKMSDATKPTDTTTATTAPIEADTIPQGFRLMLRPDYSWDAVQKLRAETEANPTDSKKGADYVIALNGHAEEKKQLPAVVPPNALQKIEPGTILNAIQRIESEDRRLAALYQGRSLASTSPAPASGDAEQAAANKNAIIVYKPFEVIPSQDTKSKRAGPDDEILEGEYYPVIKYKPFPVIPYTKTTYSWQQPGPRANFTDGPLPDSAPETGRSAPVDRETVQLRDEVDPLKQYGSGRDSINGNGNKYNVLGDGNTVTYNFGGDPKLKDLLEKTRAELERANATPAGLTPTTGTAGSNGGAFGAPSWHNQATWLDNNTSSLGLGGWLTAGTVVASALGAPVLPLAWMFGSMTAYGVWGSHKEHMQRLKWLHEESMQERKEAHETRLAELKNNKDKKPALSAADVIANGDITVPGGTTAGQKGKETTDAAGADLGPAGGGKRGGTRYRRPTAPAAAVN